MLKWFTSTFASREITAEEQLYIDIVERARQPIFYADYGVSDSLSGRFEMIVLHMFAVLERLKTEGDEGQKFGQRLLEVFFSTLDGDLREMGVGDTSVPKKMQKAAEATYGRLQSYAQARMADTPAELAQAFERNVFEPDVLRAPQPGALVTYLEELMGVLQCRSFDELQRGAINWPDAKPA
ncbi:MAG: ubiquinol-cytochrome C chaperone family protein [Pseudomonadota bacterium]